MKYRRSSFAIEGVPGDGNCMYHSCGRYLNEPAEVIRKKVCKFIRENPEKKFNGEPLNKWIHWASETDCERYSQYMSKNGVWGGATELVIISHIYEVNIQVLTPMHGEDFYKVVSDISHPTAHKRDTIFLLWTGSHYSNLRVK